MQYGETIAGAALKARTQQAVYNSHSTHGQEMQGWAATQAGVKASLEHAEKERLKAGTARMEAEEGPLPPAEKAQRAWRRVRRQMLPEGAGEQVRREVIEVVQQWWRTQTEGTFSKQATDGTAPRVLCQTAQLIAKWERARRQDQREGAGGSQRRAQPGEAAQRGSRVGDSAGCSDSQTKREGPAKKGQQQGSPERQTGGQPAGHKLEQAG